jgi:RNA polymerase sigma-70 factor (sigma-E family)
MRLWVRRWLLVRLAWSPEFEEYATADLPRLMRIARVLTGNDHDAADLVQDCLAKMGRRWSDGAPIANPHAYARATLVNLNVSRLRRVRREWLVRSVPEPEAVDLVQTASLDPWLEAALAALPVRQRAAVALAYLEDLQVDDIAKALGCAVSTAKTHLARGREALKRAADAEESNRGSVTPLAKEGRPSWTTTD